MPASILYLSRDNLDHSASFSIDGKVYEYFLSPSQLDTTEYLARKVSSNKALVFTKKHCRIIRSRFKQVPDELVKP